MSRACRMLSLLFAFALVASFLAPAFATDFTDVPKYHWAWRYIKGVSDAGIGKGYNATTYAPDVIVTRDQMAVYVARGLAGGDEYVPTGPATATFDDVKPGTWAYKYIEYCADPVQDVVRGYGGAVPTYGPAIEVTRDQMAVYVARAVAGGDDHVPTGPATATFSDVQPGTWAYDYVEYCADPARGIVVGYDGKDGKVYLPGNKVTRDQMAVYMCRAFNLATPSQPYNVTDYYPTDIGRTWTYKSPTDAYSVSATGTSAIGGQTYTALATSPSGNTEYWQAAEDGLRMASRYDASESATYAFSPPLFLPNGIDPGFEEAQTVAVASNGAALGNATFTPHFLGLETITTPAGTFADCLKVEIRLDLPGGIVQHSDMWFAKGIGLVKKDSRAYGGTDWSEITGYAVPSADYQPPLNVTDYFPLDEGDTWTRLAGWGTLSESIQGTTTLSGQSYANKVNSEGNTEYWQAAADGLHYGGFSEDIGQVTFKPVLVIPNGMTVGQVVNGSAQIYVDGALQTQATMVLKLADVSDVTVPAGTFQNCLKLEMRLQAPGLGENHYYQWLAKGVGEVIWDSTPFEGTQSDLLVLQSATIGGVAYP